MALVGYKGRDAFEKAMERSRYATVTPRVRALADGSLVGVGDVILRSDGTQDVRLYGARGTSTWESEITTAANQARQGV